MPDADPDDLEEGQCYKYGVILSVEQLVMEGDDIVDSFECDKVFDLMQFDTEEEARAVVDKIMEEHG